MQGWNTEDEDAEETDAAEAPVETAAEEAADDAEALVESRAAERSAAASESGSTAESGAAEDDETAGRTAANMAAMEGVAALPAGTACRVLAR